jgi:Zn finger protein HypA/HybF involved in hydrogenase expression
MRLNYFHVDLNKTVDELDSTVKEAAGSSHVTKIFLRLGEYVTLPKATLLSELHKRFPTASIEVQETFGKVHCLCGYIGKPVITRDSDVICLVCPKCKKKYPHVVEGDEIELSEIEVE